MLKRFIYIFIIYILTFTFTKNSYADWLEITLLSGEWKDWKIALQKISQKVGTTNKKQRRIRTGHSGGIRVGVPQWGMGISAGSRYNTDTSTNSGSLQYKGIDEIKIPKMFLVAFAAVEGHKKYGVISQIMQGHTATWRDKFVVNSKKMKDEFITFELKVIIPTYNNQFLSLGSKTLSIRELSMESKVWNISITSGMLSILIKKLPKNIIVKQINFTGNKNNRNRTHYKHTINIPPKYIPTFYATGAIKFLFKNVCSHLRNDKTIFISFPDGSNDIKVMGFASIKNDADEKKASDSFNKLQQQHNCNILDYGTLYTYCKIQYNTNSKRYYVGRYLRLPPSRRKNIECKLFSNVHGTGNYYITVVLTPIQQEE